MNKLIIAYLALISILAAVITIIDKINAKTDSRRIPGRFSVYAGSSWRFIIRIHNNEINPT